MISLYEADETPPEATFISEDNKLGLTTSTSTKMKSCIKLKELVERNIIKIHSTILLTELKSFIRKAGSYAAQVGATDDCVSATLIMIRMLEEIASYDDRAYHMLYAFQAEQESWVPDLEDEYSIPMPMIL